MQPCQAEQDLSEFNIGKGKLHGQSHSETQVPVQKLVKKIEKGHANLKSKKEYFSP